MLQSIQAQIHQIGSFGMAINSKHTAFFVKAVELGLVNYDGQACRTLTLALFRSHPHLISPATERQRDRQGADEGLTGISHWSRASWATLLRRFESNR